MRAFSKIAVLWSGVFSGVVVVVLLQPFYPSLSPISHPLLVSLLQVLGVQALRRSNHTLSSLESSGIICRHRGGVLDATSS